MHRQFLTLTLAVLCTPAMAHPGSAQDHEHLSVFAHLVVTALPIVVPAALIALLVQTYRRRKA